MTGRENVIMKQRLQKLISAAGLASRRAAETLINQGRVTVNGQVASLGESADPEQDVICVDGIPLQFTQRHTYILLHKPVGYVTTCKDEQGRRTVMDLVADLGVRVFPVGRLDLNSEGLLLLTDDGDLANRLMHPSFRVEKTYRVDVEGLDSSQEILEQLRQPVTLDDGDVVQALEIKSPRRNQLEITIGEGKNRQVRRMCQAVGLRVRRLCRIREGSLVLGDLPKGKWRHLTARELEQLRQEC